MTKLRSLVFAAFLALPLASFAQVEFSVGWAPPPLPVFDQPPVPGPGYIWTPGYWAWGDWDYYWVPGVWVLPPSVGLLWTPPWWGWRNGVYAFNQGFWGPTVGFYGGINYGFGYTGNGFWGGQWRGNNFYYNKAVTNVNTNIIHNTFVNNSFTKNVNVNRTSFNGGPNGIKAQPNAEQKAALANAKKVGPTSQQLAFKEAATKDPNLRASVNKGKPSTEAVNSFKQGQGKGAQALGAAGGAAGAAGAGAGDKLGEHQGQGTGMGGEEHGKKGENEIAGNKHEKENLHGNNQDVLGNQAGKHNKGLEHGGAGNGQNAMNQQMMMRRQQQMKAQHHQQQMMMGMGGQQHMNQMQHNQQMRNAQMGAGKHPQMQSGGGGKPHPNGGQQQQGKKKPNEH